MAADSEWTAFRKPTDPEYEKALDDFDRDASDAEQLATMLLVDYQLFEGDRTNSLPALDAIAQIAAFKWRQEAAGKKPLAPDQLVSVPWWAIQTIAAAYCQYAIDGLKMPPIKLGKAFQIEASGRGRRPRLRKWMQMKRDHRCAVGIALRHVKGTSVEKAIDEVSEVLGLSRERLWQIWGEHKDRALEIARRVRNIANSLQ